MKTIHIEGQLRTEIGKKYTRRLRSELQVPGVIYGGKEVVNFFAPKSAFKPITHTSDFVIVEVKIADKSYRCILKESQYDKISDELIHVDLQELVDNTKVIVTLPIHFMGNPEGVKKGGKFLQKLKQLKVKALPKDLKESIEVNIDHLDLEQNIRVSDIKEPKLEIVNSPRVPIASVTLTRVLKQEVATAPAEAAAGTPAAKDAKAEPAKAAEDAKKPDAKKPEGKKG